MNCMMRTAACFHLAFMAACGVCWSGGIAQPIAVSMCELWENPERYTGKIVRVRAGSRGDLWIEQMLHDAPSETCSAYMGITLAFPDQVVPRPDFRLVRDKSYEEFVEALRYPGPIHVDATYEGRFDAAFVWRDHKRLRVGMSKEKGYGKKHRYDGRIVLYRVSDVWSAPLPAK